MSDDLAHFRALPHETKLAIIRLMQASIDAKLRDLLGEQRGRGLRCQRCQQPVSQTVDGICEACASRPVPCEVAGPEWEERE